MRNGEVRRCLNELKRRKPPLIQRIIVLCGLILMIPTLLAGCGSAVDEIPPGYLARSVIADSTSENSLGQPEIYGDYEEIFIYPDKTYIRVRCQEVEPDHYNKSIASVVKVQTWDELAPVLSDTIYMEEGDVLRFNARQCIGYLKDTCP